MRRGKSRGEVRGVPPVGGQFEGPGIGAGVPADWNDANSKGGTVGGRNGVDAAGVDDGAAEADFGAAVADFGAAGTVCALTGVDAPSAEAGEGGVRRRT